jgi:hypothetical protein
MSELKLERIRTQLFDAGSSRAAPLPPPPMAMVPRELTLANVVNNWIAQQATTMAAPHGRSRFGPRPTPR